MQHHLRDKHPPCAAHACCASSHRRGQPCSSNAAQQLPPSTAGTGGSGSAATEALAGGLRPSNWAFVQLRSLDAPWARGRNPPGPGPTCSKPPQTPPLPPRPARLIACLRNPNPRTGLRLCGWAARPDLRQCWKDGCWRERRGASSAKPGLKARVARSALRRWWPKLRPNSGRRTRRAVSAQDELQSAGPLDRAGWAAAGPGRSPVAPRIRVWQTLTADFVAQPAIAPCRVAPIRLFDQVAAAHRVTSPNGRRRERGPRRGPEQQGPMRQLPPAWPGFPQAWIAPRCQPDPPQAWVINTVVRPSACRSPGAPPAGVSQLGANWR